MLNRIGSGWCGPGRTGCGFELKGGGRLRWPGLDRDGVGRAGQGMGWRNRTGCGLE